MERIDDLQFKGLYIIQDDEAACFTEDAVLLANYLRLKPTDAVIDIGCGGGLLCILGEGKTGARFTGVDKQTRLIELARRSAEMNAQAIAFHAMDAADAPAFFGHGAFTAAVMNPPYFSAESAGISESRALARHGGADTLNTFLTATFLLLKNGGKLFLCWPAEGLTDIFSALRKERLEPKRMTLVCRAGKPRLALIEARKLGKSGLILTLAEQPGGPSANAACRFPERRA